VLGNSSDPAFRFGTNATGLAAGFTGTAYNQLATFVTASVTPTAVTASAGCSDQSFSASGLVTQGASTTNSTAPTTADIALNVIPPSALGAGSVIGVKTATAGDVTLHFCISGSASSWTPPAGTYTVQHRVFANCMLDLAAL